MNRDTLFCYHKASEEFLQRLMSLYVSSHYKNSPNDLQMLSDAPAHNIFVLLGPISVETATLPEILCVVQVCLEGHISRGSVMSSLARGKRASGDLIPWTISQQVELLANCLSAGIVIMKLSYEFSLDHYVFIFYSCRYFSFQTMTHYSSGHVVVYSVADTQLLHVYFIFVCFFTSHFVHV